MKKLLLALFLSILTSTGFAQTVPNEQFDPYKHPVKIIIGWAPGGASDFVVRMLADHISTHHGIKMIVVNKVGGMGAIAYNEAITSPPDGHTLFVTVTSAVVINQLLKNEPLNTDIKHITIMGESYVGVFVNTEKIKSRNLKDLIVEMKADPNKANVASGYFIADLTGQSFFKHSGIKTQSIRYNGSAQALVGILSGSVPIMIDTPAEAVTVHVKSGKLALLGITTKTVNLPDVAVMTSVFPKWNTSLLGWAGLAAPPKTPDYIVDFYNKLFVEALNDETIKAKIIAQSWIVHGESPASATKFIKDQYYSIKEEMKGLKIE